MRQSWGACCSCCWAVPSTVSRSKVGVWVGLGQGSEVRGDCSSVCVEYIQTIMMMEESVQHVVMTAIQEVDDTLLSQAGQLLTVCVSVCPQLMSKETPVSGGNDSYVDLDRQVPGTAPDRPCLTCESPVWSDCC